MNTELLPCPFCGGKSKLHESVGMQMTGNKFWVGCKNPACLMLGGTGKVYLKEDAVTVWNRRPILSPILSEDVVDDLQPLITCANYCIENQSEGWAGGSYRNAIKKALEILPALILERDSLRRELEAERGKLNTPEINDFIEGVRNEILHQAENRGAADKEKTSDEFYWVLAFLATKAKQALHYGDIDKAKHHLITTAALCGNWHRVVSVLPEKPEA